MRAGGETGEIQSTAGNRLGAGEVYSFKSACYCPCSKQTNRTQSNDELRPGKRTYVDRQQSFLLVQTKILLNLLNSLVQLLLSLSHNSHLHLPCSPPPLHRALPSLWPNPSPAVPKLSPWYAPSTAPHGTAVRSNVTFCHLKPSTLGAVSSLTNQGQSQASHILIMSENGISSASASSSALSRNPPPRSGKVRSIEAKSIQTVNPLIYPHPIHQERLLVLYRISAEAQSRWTGKVW